MELNFWKANSKDIELLLTLMQEFYQLEHLNYDRQIISYCLAELFNNEQLGIAWLIFADSEVVGYLVLTFGYSIEFHGRDALVDELYIREAYRGKGIGTKALELVETACEFLGIKAVHLVVAHENSRAKKVYQKVGFIEHERYIMTKWTGNKI